MSVPVESHTFELSLRRQAEETLRHRPQAPPDASTMDLQRLVHELQVHQIELELQNEELRRRQEALQQARDEYAALYDLAPVGYLTLDAEGTILKANLTAAAMLGVARNALPGTPLSRLVARDDQDRLYLHRLQVLEGDAPATCELRLHGPEGREWVAALDSRRLQAAEDPRFQWAVTLSDITSRKRAEDAMRQSEARMRGIVETAVDGILTINEQGGIESFNLAAERIFNCRAADVIGNPVTLLMASPDRELYETSLRMGGRHMMDASREVVGKRRDGETFPLELTAGETPIGGQRFFTVIVRDISERKRVADQLQQAERLALVGQLASGLVHEIGTPLNIISGSGELLLMDLQAQQLPTETAEAIIRQTERITGLMQQLLTLSRPEQPAMRPFSLHAPLDEALHLLDAAFHRDRIKVTRDIPNELPSLWGIADQIEQVFLNVLVNAWQAMPYGGEITIAARQTDDGVIHLTFHDTGVGMESAEVERAFEPFYTSKGSQGTGLGLMVCKQIVEAHQGRMALESVSGVGTTVHLHLSCVSGAP